ncbi:Protein of uncharacterised function (DUF421) [Legionella lansingensis]|uniref:YetF C-terminal domain-containing protein n=1 Tax=Legionella lansingensis TaxID=45067 RepID=A0A0W0V796_9GAMM|nr:YetF domain-containing protein [Legionella lansingensis]KTD15976.1 hypothetical protein Llan_2564 [Legionella lansingensis]SNV56557.1 Protein of uncharacterised function (DUF421) [Legionella lansingensis]
MDFFANINNNQDIIYVIIRSFLLFSLSIILIRFGNRRYHLHTAFDYLLLVILGGLLSRGINGNASFISTVVAAASLVIFHRWIAIITFHFRSLDYLLKGKARLIIKDGEILTSQLKKYHLTKADILTEMRTKMNTDDPKKIAAAYLEATGTISFIAK